MIVKHTATVANLAVSPIAVDWIHPNYQARQARLQAQADFCSLSSKVSMQTCDLGQGAS